MQNLDARETIRGLRMKLKKANGELHDANRAHTRRRHKQQALQRDYNDLFDRYNAVVKHRDRLVDMLEFEQRLKKGDPRCNLRSLPPVCIYDGCLNVAAPLLNVCTDCWKRHAPDEQVDAP